MKETTLSWQEYCLSLDQEIFQIANGQQNFSQTLYDWLIADTKGYRKQAFKSYPLVCHYLYTEYTDDFIKIVDQGLPLVKSVNELTGLSTKIIKSLSGISSNDIKCKLYYDQYIFFCILKAMDISELKLPGEGAISCEDGWKVIYLLAQIAFEGWAKVDGSYGYEYITKFDFYSDVSNFLICNQELWLQKKHLNLKIHEDSIKIMDMIHQFSNQILLPLAADEFSKFKVTGDLMLLLSTAADKFSCIEHVLTRHHSIASLSKLSNHWHRHHASIDAKIVEPSSEIKWISLVPEQTIKGLKIIPLTSAKMLVEEGENLLHCVAGYTNECSSGKSQIFSVRNKDGIPTSTFEIRVHEIKPEVRIIQHQAINNSLPCNQDVDAVKLFMDKINWGATKIDWNSWRDHFNSQKKLSREITLKQACGYDPNNTASRDKALKAWKFIIPRELKELNSNEWANHLQLSQMLKKAGLNITNAAKA